MLILCLDEFELRIQLQQLFDYILLEVVSIVVVVRGGVMVDCDDNRTIIMHYRRDWLITEVDNMIISVRQVPGR